MNFVFPEGVYADVRIEHVFSTNISFMFRDLEECRERSYSAAFIRVFDGNRWYYSSTSDIEAIQKEINTLAGFASKNNDIHKSKIYENFSSHKGETLAYANSKVSDAALDEKIKLLQSMMPFVENNEYIKLWNIRYLDEYKVKEFYNSKGANLKFDFQRCGYSCGFQMVSGDRHFRESFQRGRANFNDLFGFETEIAEKINEACEYLLNSVPVEPGTYSVILAPIVTGVFAHECFGHKSESDFMVGDEEAKKEWVLGKKLGSEELSIIETGTVSGGGYVPYDDEGNKAGVNYLVKNGVLTGRLHNSASAADLGEPVTGNGRAISYEYEPIVRMTTTYIDKGGKTLEQLIKETDKGILVNNCFHGSGMSTFTIAPSLAYYIKDGKIAEPVRISVISGNVFEALSNIDGISDKVELLSFVTGGCGKMEQYPLSVGFGGPHIRVKNMNVQ